MHILIAIDDTSTMRAAIEVVERFKFPAITGVTLLHVLPTVGVTTVRRAPAQREISKQAECLLAEASERLGTTGWITQMRTREGYAAEQIVHACREVGADLVVVGSHAHGALHRSLLGSVSRKVMKYAPCSTLVVRSAEQGASMESVPHTVLRYLVTYDDSEAANAVIHWLSSLPLSENAHVQLVTVLVPITVYRLDVLQTQSPEWRAKKQRAKEILDKAAERLHQRTPNVVTHVREGRDESEEILKAASEFDAHLIVVGATGCNRFERFLHGSVLNRIIHHATCAVLAVRPPGHFGAEAATDAIPAHSFRTYVFPER